MDERCGDNASMPSVTRRQETQRCSEFDQSVRKIVQCLQTLAHNQSATRVMTQGFQYLLCAADEDFLVTSVLDGVPKSTKLILGKEQFTINELTCLPCLSDSELSEHGIYVDVVQVGDNILEWRTYVGSSSKVIRRWYTYLTERKDSIYHSQYIRRPGRIINLRCIAHFGFQPDFWLTTFAETIFTVYIGTVHDPRANWKGPEYSNKYMNDELYEAFGKVRLDCALQCIANRGLNRTWPLAQGWRGVGITSGAECVNCKRVVPQTDDPTFHRSCWVYVDPCRPSGNNVMCMNCRRFGRVYGRARPVSLEKRRTTPRPDHCEYPGCTSSKKLQFCNLVGHDKAYCDLHYQRARKSREMAGPSNNKSGTKVSATVPRTDHCQHPDCNEPTYGFCGRAGHMKYYCAKHLHRAAKGTDMDEVRRAPKGSSKPAVCQHPGCERPSKNFSTAHQKHYCKPHYDRAKKGEDMDAFIRQSKTAPGSKKPALCQNPAGCDRPPVHCLRADGKSYCLAHYHRAKDGKDMDDPPLRKQRGSIDE